MKKFLVISVLALFLVTLPVLAVTDSDFTADGNITVNLNLNGTADGDSATIIIKSGSEARSITVNANGTLDILNASSTSFKLYSTDTTVKAIKVASSSTIVSCTEYANATASSPVTIASSTDPIATSTITLISVPNAATYNSSCGAATCNQAYQVSGTGADATCAACTVLTGVDTYNSTCGAATCNTGYTLSGSGSSATCVPPPAISGPGATASSGSSNQPTTTTTPTPTTTTTPTPTTTTTPAPTNAAAKAAEQIKNIVAEAATIAGRSVEQVLAAVGAMRDAKAETTAETKYTANLVSGLKNITAEVKTAITNFVNYGTPTTKILGAGERAGVINSYKAAFGKVPSSESEWSDAIKIGNGRWPTERSATAETQATAEFKKVYKRSPNMSKPHDNAAVTVIAYGLRPVNRNLNSEKAAIKSFKAIYGHNPVSALAWDIVRAIAYSGATR